MVEGESSKPDFDLTTGRRVRHQGNRIAKAMVIAFFVFVAASVMWTMRGVFSSQGSGDVVLHDEFEAPSSDWPVRDVEDVKVGFSEDGYRILVRPPDTAYVVWHVGREGSWDAVSVE